MAEVVCAYASSHVLFDPSPAPERAERIVAGMQKLGNIMAEKRPDVILMISTEHMFNINLEVSPPFCVGISDEWEPFGEMEIPKRIFKGNQAFGLELVEYSANNGFDLAVCQGIKPDHGITLPLLFIKPWGLIPVVPLIVNINMKPLPSTERCHALADTIRRWIVEQRPAGERIGIIASGGLSHWLNVPGQGTVAEEFDKHCLELLTQGRFAELTNMTVTEIEQQAGNGGLELLNWIMMAAIVPEAKGELIYYEPMPAWHTGMAGIAMHV